MVAIDANAMMDQIATMSRNVHHELRGKARFSPSAAPTRLHVGLVVRTHWTKRRFMPYSRNCITFITYD